MVFMINGAGFDAGQILCGLGMFDQLERAARNNKLIMAAW